jgi:ADP-ribosylation factor-like protein 13B
MFLPLLLIYRFAEADPFIVPTVGFSAPIKKRLHGRDVVLYDLGGGARIRGVWPQYFADVHGIIYVVDAADPARLEESRAELHSALLHPMVVGKPVLV